MDFDFLTIFYRKFNFPYIHQFDKKMIRNYDGGGIHQSSDYLIFASNESGLDTLGRVHRSHLSIIDHRSLMWNAVRTMNHEL